MSMVHVPTPRQCDNLIGGQWRRAAEGRTRPLVSPYTGSVIGTVALSGAEDVAAVVDGARAGATAWRNTPIKERSRPLFRFRELMLANLAEISNLAALEAG